MTVKTSPLKSMSIISGLDVAKLQLSSNVTQRQLSQFLKLNLQNVSLALRDSFENSDEASWLNKSLQSTVGAGIPNAFRITMVTLCLVFQWRLVFQWCSVLNKMATILFKTFGNWNKMAAILFEFPMVWFSNGQVHSNSYCYDRPFKQI